jgi:hypothetical protein
MVDRLPPIEPDPVIEVYKKDVDRIQIRENLKLTVEERFLKLMERQKFVEEVHRASDEICGLCERGTARMVYLPQDLRVGTERVTIENVPMRECDTCQQQYFLRDVAITLEQIRLKLLTSGKPSSQLRFEFIDREQAA